MPRFGGSTTVFVLASWLVCWLVPLAAHWAGVALPPWASLLMLVPIAYAGGVALWAIVQPEPRGWNSPPRASSWWQKVLLAPTLVTLIAIYAINGWLVSRRR